VCVGKGFERFRIIKQGKGGFGERGGENAIIFLYCKFFVDK